MSLSFTFNNGPFSGTVENHVNFGNPVAAITYSNYVIFPRQLQLSIDDVSVTEGDSGHTTAHLTVSLDAASALDTTFDFATADGSAGSNDYGAVSGNGVIAAGETSTTIEFTIAGDLLPEVDEFFFVHLSNIDGAVGDDTEGKVTILNDDDLYGLSLTPAETRHSEGDAGRIDYVFTLSSDRAVAEDVTVDFAVTGAVDAADFGGTLPQGSATIAAGETSTSIVISVTGDTDIEPDEMFRLVLSNASANARIDIAAARATILNDDDDETPPVIETILGTGGADRIVGTSASEKILAGGGADVVHSGGGNDELHGGGAADLLFGGKGADTIFGGTGKDVLSGGTGKDTLTGGSGSDVLRAMAGHDKGHGGGGSDLLSGGRGKDVLRGGAGQDLVFGGADNDRLFGGEGRDLVIGGMGKDMLSGGSGKDVLRGINGNDRSFGGAGDDILSGGKGIDVLTGGAGRDLLLGGAGNDRLFGNAGRDVLIGGAGKDMLSGGSGADHFVFRDRTDTGPAAAGGDTILDFSRSQGDTIGLGAIDAIASTAAKEAFTFIGETRFSDTAGELRFTRTKGETIIEGDMNGDGKADFTLLLDHAIHLRQTDFVL
jgi:Ca2+-binding RTX toxin-like protein